MIEAIHIPDPMRLSRPSATGDERQQHHRRRPQPRRDGIPTAKVYAPDGHVETPHDPDVEDFPRIDLVG